MKGSHLPVVSQASLFREPPQALQLYLGASARRQLPETTSSRAWGSFQTGQKQHFSNPMHRPLSTCMWFFRDLIYFSLKNILIRRGFFPLYFFSPFALSVLSIGRRINLSNLRTPLLASYFLFASSGLFTSKESISNINSLFPMETSTLLPKEELRQAFSCNIHFMHSPISTRLLQT